MPGPSSKKRIWSVAEFAMHLYGEKTPAAHLRAKRRLLALQAKHPKTRFLEGGHGGYRITVATLRRLERDLFEPVESIEARLEFLEEEVAELRVKMQRVVIETMVPIVAKLNRRIEALPRTVRKAS